MPSPSPSSQPSGTLTNRASTSAAKRSAPSDSNTHTRNSERPWKRRSSKACLSCRNRKVRCDVVDGGVPCTNCRLDDIDCILKESNRGRRPTTAACQRNRKPNQPAHATTTANRSSESETRSIHVTSHPVLPASETFEADEISEPDDPQDETGSLSGSHTVEPAQMMESSNLPSSRRQAINRPSSDGDQLSNTLFDQQQEPLNEEPMDEIHVQVGEDQEPNSQVSAPAPAQRLTPVPSLDYADPIRGFHAPFASTQTQIDQVSPALPLFIRPPPQHLDSRDMEYLSHKLCLSIPDPEFRHELLRVYTTVVHPFLPVLDMEDYAGSILHNNGRNPISLLLFQAVNFVSVTFIDLKFLQSRGYASRLAARRDFFDRVRILYSLNYETDRMILVQSLLLLTHWYDGPDDDKDTWYWMGIALTNAQVGGLHRNPEHLKIPPQEKKLRRRLWWCCVMRDRLLALGIRSPPRINEDDHNVKPLTLDDFELSPSSANMDKLFEGSKARYPDLDKRQSLARMCIELSILCVYIGRTLNTLYTVMGNYFGGVEYTQQSISRPDRFPEHAKALAERNSELKGWMENQNANSRYIPKTRPRSSGSNSAEELRSDAMMRFHQAQLHMVYLTALGALQRPQVVRHSSGDDTENNSSLPNAVSRGNVTDTAVEMTKLAFNLQRDNQLRFLPTLAVPAYLAVTLVHLFNTCSIEEEDRSLSLGRLYQCVSVIQQLQDMYTSADYAMQFLNSILRNTGLHVPWTLPTGNKKFGDRDDIVSRPRLDMGPHTVAASCMYPSPSTSGNWNQESSDESGMGQENTQQPVIVQHQQQQQQAIPLAVPSIVMETWATTGQGDMGDLLAGSPFPGAWCDVETLLPALMTFEGETDGLTTGNLAAFM